MYGHAETLAQAVAHRARAVADTQVTLKRVPELMPEAIACKPVAKLDHAVDFAEVDERADYDAIIFGTPTRFGNMAAPVRSFRRHCRSGDMVDLSRLT